MKQDKSMYINTSHRVGNIHFGASRKTFEVVVTPALGEESNNKKKTNPTLTSK